MEKMDGIIAFGALNKMTPMIFSSNFDRVKKYVNRVFDLKKGGLKPVTASKKIFKRDQELMEINKLKEKWVKKLNEKEGEVPSTM